MKHLSQALQKSIGQQAQMQERMLLTIEKLAESLQPSVRQALNPIGQSVDAINLISAATDEAPSATFVLDKHTKELAEVSRNHSITRCASDDWADLRARHAVWRLQGLPSQRS